MEVEVPDCGCNCSSFPSFRKFRVVSVAHKVLALEAEADSNHSLSISLFPPFAVSCWIPSSLSFTKRT